MKSLTYPKISLTVFQSIKMKIMECPVFHPSKEEFSNFERYMEKIESESSGFGMAKVIPPANWKARRQGYKNINASITHPVKQIVSGFAGIYQVILISEKPISYNTYKNYSIMRDPSPTLTNEEIERLVLYT